MPARSRAFAVVPALAAAAAATVVAAAFAAVAAAPAAALPLGEPVVRATGLSTPWAIAVAPDGRVFVTERSDRNGDIDAAPPTIRELEPTTTTGVSATPVFTETDPAIAARKFLGLALHPSFATNRLAYLYETYTRGNVWASRVIRLVDDGTKFTADGKVLIDGIGSDGQHDGGRIEFGPDGKLYVTTGDIHQPSRPRDRQNLNGKILRLEAPGTDADGTAPADNPFVDQGGNARFVWSLGHRHPQGIAWDAAGRLWETEHGPSGEAHAPVGAKNGRDEINLIVKGGDYGWPQSAGEFVEPGTIPPVVQSGPAPAWAPGGLAFAADGRLYSPMLNGMHLRALTPVPCAAAVTDQVELYKWTYNRLRSATHADGVLWITTDDGRVLRVRVAEAGTTPAVPAPCPGGEDPDPTDPDPIDPDPIDPDPVDPDPTDQTTPTTPTTPDGPPATPQPQPAPQPTPPALVTRPSSSPPATTTRADLADRLLTRGTTTARRLGIRGLLRRGSFTVEIAGLGSDRAIVRLMHGATTVARGTAQSGSRASATVRVRLTKAGRRVLRGRSSARLTLRTDVLPKGARTGVTRRARVTLGAR